ncbi:HIT family protein [Candidatus Saccharibacteria bacterium]|nr:HIT family protein [Candidatus Saccharibacteria bacterium]
MEDKANEDSVFTKIIKGEIPSFKLYEDDKTLAILTINPSQPGHTLVIPKVQIDHLDDLDEVDYQAVWNTVHKVSRRLKEVFKRRRIGIQVMGLEVPHAHVHVLPFDTLEEFVFIPNPDTKPNFEALEEVAKQINNSAII